MGEIASNFKGLPLEDLIASPLVASAMAQGKLSGITNDFINSMINDDGTAKTVSFKHSNSAGKSIDVNVPLLAITNVPNLSIKKVNIDFNMEVRTSSKSSNETKVDVKTEAAYKSWYSPVSVKMTANLSSKSNSERSTDKSAKYTVHVEASDTGLPEGLSRLLDIFESAIPTPSDLDA